MWFIRKAFLYSAFLFFPGIGQFYKRQWVKGSIFYVLYFASIILAASSLGFNIFYDLMVLAVMAASYWDAVRPAQKDKRPVKGLAAGLAAVYLLTFHILIAFPNGSFFWEKPFLQRKAEDYLEKKYDEPFKYVRTEYKYARFTFYFKSVNRPYIEETAVRTSGKFKDNYKELKNSYQAEKNLLDTLKNTYKGNHIKVTAFVYQSRISFYAYIFKDEGSPPEKEELDKLFSMLNQVKSEYEISYVRISYFPNDKKFSEKSYSENLNYMYREFTITDIEQIQSPEDLLNYMEEF